MGYEYVAIPKSETYKLIENAQKGDDEAKERLITQNAGLVKKVASKYASWGFDMDDLMQLGFVGLVKAINNFNTKYDVMFSTYAIPMILGEIKRFIRDDSNIKISRQVKTDVRRMRSIREKFLLCEGRYPRMSELAQLVEVSKEYLVELIEAEEAMCSSESLDDPNNTNQYSLLENKTGEGSWEKVVDKICLKNIIRELGEQERKIIVLRYFKDMTQQQVASILGISQVQVSRIEKRTLKHMKLVYES